ncbi:MAG TPA: MazG nucleotide pyrophosphohydrolase domain-containing protein [Candidatus Pristimantibacillus sp.]|jgi:NTP pyrophosphatase (non-canonical NTP hydrolase)|nr:MazG nucleotide pyrophosphohydrolase domain-containing protein [Candidatus Pristimantibacillus sp.]
MSELHLKEGPTLADLQAYVAQMVKDRGFDEESVPERFMLLLEEAGEFAKAARKSQGIKFAADSVAGELEHEAADVLILLLALCNDLHIDLEQAVRAKEEKNKKRVWK